MSSPLAAFKTDTTPAAEKSGRVHDLQHIRALLRANRGSVDRDQVRGYFLFFDKPRYSMKSCVKSTDAPFAVEAGRGWAAAATGNPFSALDDLMAAVDDSGPIWPARAVFVDAGRIRL